MCIAFVLGMLAMLLPSAGVFGWAIWNSTHGRQPSTVSEQSSKSPRPPNMVVVISSKARRA
jgi:hypothetical protein